MPALADPASPDTLPDEAGAAPPARNPRRWADLRLRAASALVLAPVAVLCTWYDGWAWIVLMKLAMAGLIVEWMAMAARNGTPRKPSFQFSVVGTTLVVMAAVIGGPGTTGLLAALSVFAAMFLLLLLVTGRLRLAAGVLYLGVPMAALVWLRDTGEVGRSNVLFLAIVVWASDIGAYVAGRLLGGRKLAPAISPGKTWSGAVGGLLAAMAFGEAAAQALAPAGFGRAAAAACVLSIVSQAGDLLESWIKRQFGVKDSGRLIPGHGGLLDRLDGMLAAATAAACIAAVVGRGGVLWQ